MTPSIVFDCILERKPLSHFQLHFVQLFMLLYRTSVTAVHAAVQSDADVGWSRQRWRETRRELVGVDETSDEQCTRDTE